MGILSRSTTTRARTSPAAAARREPVHRQDHEGRPGPAPPPPEQEASAAVRRHGRLSRGPRGRRLPAQGQRRRRRRGHVRGQGRGGGLRGRRSRPERQAQATAGALLPPRRTANTASSTNDGRLGMFANGADADAGQRAPGRRYAARLHRARHRLRLHPRAERQQRLSVEQPGWDLSRGAHAGRSAMGRRPRVTSPSTRARTRSRPATPARSTAASFRRTSASR